MKPNCPVCESPAPVKTTSVGDDVRCDRCGEFRISDVAKLVIGPRRSPRGIALLSGWLREHPGATITERDLDAILELRMPTVGEKADKVLLRLSHLHPVPGAVFQSWATDLVPQLMGAGFCLSREELEYLLFDYLCDEKRFLGRVGLPGSREVKVTPNGWAFLDSLGCGQGRQGFIAMWFDDSVNEAWKAIEAGIRSAGYNPRRIDQKEHNNDITDEIIAEIRKSKFLVADLTGHRNGVYFEAGFAKGLGLDVIWLCRKSDEKDRHFDIRQYNCIFWEADKLNELSKALKDRIEATLGRGPQIETVTP